MYNITKYFEAHSVREAIELLQANPKARLIAGGSDKLIKMHQGKIEAAELISIHNLSEISGISLEPDGTIVIGAGTTFSKIANHPVIKKNVPVLAEAVETIGGPQVRNVGTIGGNICNGSTSSDTAPTLFALNARLRIQGASGTRVIEITDFYQGPGQVDLQHDEILTAVLLSPDNYKGFAGHYIKYSMRKAMDIATGGCAVVCKITEQAVIEDFRLAFGVAAPTPVRCRKTETMVKGKTFNEELLQEVVKSAVAEVNPRTSWRASREFRLHLVEELSKRAFKQAFIKTGGKLQ